MILPEFGYGGAEKSFCSLSVELSKLYDIKIVVFNQKLAQVYPVGGEVYSLDINAGSNLIFKFRNFLRRISRLKKIKKQLKPYASISFLEGADYINILSARKEKTILSIRGSKEYDQNMSNFIGLIRKRVLIPFLYPKSDKIVTLSFGVKEELLSTYSHINRSKIHAIYNSIDDKKILKLALESVPKEWIPYFEDNKVLTLSGRLAKEKGIHLFLPIFERLSKQLDNLKLLVIGDGEYLSVLQKQCTSLNLAYQIINENNAPGNYLISFLGYQANPYKWISRSNIFVSASTHEGFGNSILEAYTCGVPVVASDCPYGPREIIANKIFKDNLDYPFHINKSVLLPVISDNDTSELWVQTILNMLILCREEEKLESRTLPDLKRFTGAGFLEKWEKVINN